MLNVVYVEGKGFIDTFDKTMNHCTYKNSLDNVYFSYSADEARSVAEFFGGFLMSFEVEE